MDRLSERSSVVKEITPDIVDTLITSYQKSLKTASLSSKMYGIEKLRDRAVQELYILYCNHFISAALYQRAENSISLLDELLPMQPRCICHGDLSDKNILFNISREPVLIDWEDAFWGIPGYDYLYWLTFFNHRKYYCKNVMQRCGLSQELSKAVAYLILKSAISYYSGSYRNNTVDMETRISEFIQAIGGENE